MKEIVNGFAEFAAIIMILITLAVVTAGVAQWAGDDATARQGEAEAPAVQVAGLGRQ